MGRTHISFGILEILSDGRVHKAIEFENKLEIKNTYLREHIMELRDFEFEIEGNRGRDGGYKLVKYSKWFEKILKSNKS